MQRGIVEFDDAARRNGECFNFGGVKTRTNTELGIGVSNDFNVVALGQKKDYVLCVHNEFAAHMVFQAIEPRIAPGYVSHLNGHASKNMITEECRSRQLLQSRFTRYISDLITQRQCLKNVNDRVNIDSIDYAPVLSECGICDLNDIHIHLIVRYVCIQKSSAVSMAP